ncbi:phospholipase A [Paucibacter sp. TC2R-5]|uniref:phospholipase A n=1 Tax=Paucibacter sp. TC2R-5 TaxID=2893555 RepID=UPI0021E4692E|nr:phospholipase A [Paucibacter sp. TC2R-5]MCV2360071.1 phospholipase A [Paucibacter sp. TC2R-5]
MNKLHLLSAGLAALAPLSAAAQSCTEIQIDAERLACYDRAAGRMNAAVPAAPAAISAPAAAAPTAVATSAPTPAPSSAPTKWTGQTFSERFQLDPETKDGLFKVKPHLPVYVLPLSWRQHVNRNPSSANPRNNALGAGETNKNLEAKFQLSLKTKMMQNILGSEIDWWAAYTQQSFWQVYNAEDSRPFRESNYQPETFVTMPLRLGSESFQLRMLNLGLVHQSNGQTDPLSRSWNRIYATLGATSGGLSLFVKPWWRVKEKAETDNNPDISDYAGRIEVQAIYNFGEHIVSATLQNNLKFNTSTPNRSNVQIEWAFPLFSELHGYVRGFAGYADSLQNYNFRNNGIGLGVSLVQWR